MYFPIKIPTSNKQAWDFYKSSRLSVFPPQFVMQIQKYEMPMIGFNTLQRQITKHLAPSGQLSLVHSYKELCEYDMRAHRLNHRRYYFSRHL